MRLAAVGDLFPGYFACVMATGIVAVASEQQSLHTLAVLLFWLAVLGYVVLTPLTVLRVVAFPRAVLADLRGHTASFAFLTQVAGTNVLGASAGLVMGWWGVAKVLWIVSLPLYVLWLYAALLNEITSRKQPAIEEGINGSWFMLTVATASIAVLGALLLDRWDAPLVAFFSAAAFCLGAVLYVIVMTMVFLRWSFDALRASELDPPEWIATGAMAITTLAGANLLAVASSQDLLRQLEPFIRGLTVMSWAAASFWFPVLVGLGVWRHLIERQPFVYVPAFWSLVFPIGMYSVCSERMFAVMSVPDMDWLPKVVLAMALVVWVATFVGMVWSWRPSGRSTAAR